MRVPVPVAVATALALLLVACATDRSALLPPTAPASVPPPSPASYPPSSHSYATQAYAPAPRGAAPAVLSPGRLAGPMGAHELAGRMGMGFRDEGDHVLLSDAGTNVRIWSNSNKVSVAGEPRLLGARTERRGSTLFVPGETVGYVEQEVAKQRAVVAAIAAPRPRPAAPPSQPVRRDPARASTPAPAPTPAPALRRSPTGTNAAWAVPAGAPARQWNWIILHHSDDLVGNLAKYDRIHRVDNGWDECGYHFVIGNGSASGNGEVEVGPRWRKQKHGAHCKTPCNCYNDHGIGICLVGDFENHGRPSGAQMDALVELCRHLMAEHGIPLADVKGHCHCAATACPGKNFPWVELRSRLAE